VEQKKISAKEVLADIRAGIPDDEIMKKYGLSAKGLQSLFDKLLKANLLTRSEYSQRLTSAEQPVELVSEAGDKVEPAGERSLEVLRDLGEKFKISKEDLERLKTASVKDIKELIEKYNMSLSDAKELFKSLGVSTSSFLTQAADKLKDGTRYVKEESQQRQSTEQGKTADITFQNLFGDWYESKKALILLLIFATPVGLYGLYKTSLFSQKTKIGIAILTVVLAIAAIKPALRLWVMGIVGIGAYALYKLLPFGRAARIAISVVAGMMVVGIIAPFIDKDSEKRRAVPAQTAETIQSVEQPVQPKPTPVAQPVPPQPVQVAQPAPQPKPEPKQKSTASGNPVSQITWSEVHSKFVKTDTDLTSAQREKLEKDRKQWWQDYRGKWVRWRGSVNNVSSGGSKVKIDMGEGSWGSDLVLVVTPDSKERAAGLNKDSYVTFVGRMGEQPGGLTAMELQEATIE
jgi:hypothetical protein